MVEADGLEGLLLELFNACDVGGTGEAPVDAVAMLLRGLGGGGDGGENDVSDEVLEGLFGPGAFSVSFATFAGVVRGVIDRRMEALFAAADADDDGVLSPAELTAAMLAAGAAEDAIAPVLAAAGDGLDFPAFRALFMSAALRGGVSQQQQQQQQREEEDFDDDEGIALEPADAAVVVGASPAGPKVPALPSLQASPQRRLSRGGGSGENAAVVVLEATSPGALSARQPLERELRAEGFSDREIDDARTAFDAADQDQDGALGFEDIHAACGGTDAEATSLLRWMDRDWSGKIEFNEFARAAHELRATTGFDLLEFMRLDGGAENAHQMRALFRAISTASGGASAAAPFPITPRTPRTPAAPLLSAAAREEVEKLREEIEKLRIARKAAEEQLDFAQQQNAALQEENERIGAQAAAATATARAATETAQKRELEMKQLVAQVEQLNTKLGDAQQVNLELRRHIKDIAEIDAWVSYVAEKNEATRVMEAPLEAIKDRLDRATRARFESAIAELAARNAELERQATTERDKASASLSLLKEESRKLRDELAHTRIVLRDTEERLEVTQRSQKQWSTLDPASFASIVRKVIQPELQAQAHAQARAQQHEEGTGMGSSLGEELQAAEAAAANRELEQRLQELHEQNASLSEQLAERTSEKKELEKIVADLQGDGAKQSSEEVARIASQLEAERRAREELAEEHKRLVSELEHSRELESARILAAQTQKEELEERLQELQEQNASLNQQLAERTSEKKELEKLVADLQGESARHAEEETVRRLEEERRAREELASKLEEIAAAWREERWALASELATQGLAEIEAALAQLNSPSSLGNTEATPEDTERGIVVLEKTTFELLEKMGAQDETIRAEGAQRGVRALPKAVAALLFDIKGLASSIRKDQQALRLELVGAAGNLAEACKAPVAAAPARAVHGVGELAAIRQTAGELTKELRNAVSAAARAIAANAEKQDSASIDERAERELLAAAAQIEALANQLREAKAKKASEPKLAPEELDVDAAIMDAALAVSQATSMLVAGAAEAQHDRVVRGRAAATAAAPYVANAMWTEGLVSAGRAVADSTHDLCDAANRTVQSKGKADMSEEGLIAAAHGVASSTAQLVSAARSKSDAASTPSLKKVEDAAKAVSQATVMLVEAAKAVAAAAAKQREQQTQAEDLSKLGAAQFRKREMEQNALIHRLERELQAAQEKLRQMHRSQYQPQKK